LKVTGGLTNESLARLVIRHSSRCRPWMRRHGVHFQPPLSGALHVARTNAFFMGGGKALVNAYYRSAQNLGVRVRYDTPVKSLEIVDGRRLSMAGSKRRSPRQASVSPLRAAFWPAAGSNPTLPGSAKPGVRMSAASGRRKTS